MKLEVWKYTGISKINSGLITLCIPESYYSNDCKLDGNHIFLGAATLDIQEPKKKKLVYQWCFELSIGGIAITNTYFGRNGIDQVREYVRCYVYAMQFKEGGKLFPLIESEKEIDA